MADEDGLKAQKLLARFNRTGRFIFLRKKFFREKSIKVSLLGSKIIIKR